jgi:predicted dehydrogenase
MPKASLAEDPVGVIGVAVVGLGGIGLLHARHLARDVAGARLVRVVDSVRELAEAAAAELDVPWSGSYGDSLADPQVEAVVIATPTPLHAQMVHGAATVGAHVFCEKPLSLDVEDGRRATQAARAAGVRLQVGFQRRFDADFAAAKRQIDAGELGTVRLLRISHRNRVPPHSTGLTDRLGSVFVDMTIHDFDSARWLVGEVAEVSSFSAGGTAITVLRFDGGALGMIDNTRSAGYGFECSAEVMGSESTLRIGRCRRPLDIERLTARGVERPLPCDHIQRHRRAYLDELRHFVACVRSGAEPCVGGEDAVAALRLSLAAEQCAT